MAGYASRGPPNGSVYVCNLPPGTDETMLAEYFGTIGLLKKDKRTGRPKIWIYRDKVTDEPKGDATVTYEDPHAASAAVEWFNNKDFHGSTIQVHIAESKNKDTFDSSAHLNVAAVVDVGGQDELDNGAGRGRGRGDDPGKAWQQDGDWMCPNTSCGNVNFAFRGVCNRCGAARPSGVGGGAGGGGRGRGRGSVDGRGGGRAGPAASGGPPGLFGPNDWPCPMCGNINWAKRMKCNICNTSKPGTNEGGVRGGRGGGYKELDEEELEEVKRRRKEAEEDDGEMYDEFGNLKKKFRAKAQRTESAEPGSGRAGWEAEHRGSAESEGRERSRDRGRNDDGEREGRERSRDRGRNGNGEREGRERSRDRDRNNNGEREGRERSRDRGRNDNGEREGRERSRDHGRDDYEKESRDRGRNDNGEREGRERSRGHGRDDYKKESRSRDHGRDDYDKESRNRDRGGHGRERRRSRSQSRDRDRETGRERSRDHDYERSRDRDRDRRR
ncbi:hypothetical protein EJB05_42526 [Eragrostis curvula]|uniref:RanBP2-type domain-containing protein n=1 Tax=Eragrostis curvula TaxID=38414 RepID=A0A5J9TCG6_9POAL|nr:hypothetical protein EJB05_42526 [Eragrostis curvula]